METQPKTHDVTFVGFEIEVDGKRIVSEYHIRANIDSLVRDDGSLGNHLRSLIRSHACGGDVFLADGFAGRSTGA